MKNYFCKLFVAAAFSLSVFGCGNESQISENTAENPAENSAEDFEAQAVTNITVTEGSSTDIVLFTATDNMSLRSVSTPLHGRATIQTPKTVRYVPNLGYTGLDSFTYIAVKGSRQYKGTVKINVLPLNHAPVAVADSATVTRGSSVTIDVLANDSDSDLGDGITIFSYTQGAQGKVANVSGKLVYTPNPTATGKDQFTYQITDEAGAKGSATVTITIVLPQPVIPVIAGGTGFSGVTPQPASVGSPTARGYDATAIARWDVVPHQRITGSINVGVVAFHINGIDRVEISANGGAPAVVREMKLNPETNVVEYFAKLNAADFADGRIELRATVYPVVGRPRVLQGENVTLYPNPTPGAACQWNLDGSPMQVLNPVWHERSLVLYANSRGTLPNTNVAFYVSQATGNDGNPGTSALPFKTIARVQQALENAPQHIADGIKVYLSEGTYNFASGWYPAKDTWITFTSNPAVTNPDNVVLMTGTQNVIFNYLKFERLKILSDRVANNFLEVNTCWSQNRNSWFDHVKVQGYYCIPTQAQPFCDTMRGLVDSNLFMTDSAWDHIADGPKGARFIRNVTASNLAGVVFQNTPIVLNATVNTIERGYYDVGYHTDVIQMYNPPTSENIIFYGMKATDVQSIGLNAGNFTNSAVVNYFVDKGRFGRDAESVQLSVNNSHLLLWHITFLNTGVVWYADLNNWTPHLIDIQGNIFGGMSAGAFVNGGWTASPEAAQRISSSPDIYFRSNHFSSFNPYAGIKAGTDMTEGVPEVDASGKPTATSNLKNRVPVLLVNNDAGQTVRELNATKKPSLGAFE